jgi:hypothetical protein
MVHPESPLGRYLKAALENPSFFIPPTAGGYIDGSVITNRLEAIKKFVESQSSENN